jgi:hypothetical protein
MKHIGEILQNFAKFRKIKCKTLQQIIIPNAIKQSLMNDYETTFYFID